jgi:hypothetical protein
MASTCPHGVFLEMMATREMREKAKAARENKNRHWQKTYTTDAVIIYIHTYTCLALSLVLEGWNRISRMEIWGYYDGFAGIFMNWTLEGVFFFLLPPPWSSS